MRACVCGVKSVNSEFEYLCYAHVTFIIHETLTVATVY